MFRVSLNGRRFPLHEVREHPERYAIPLSQARTLPGHALCHCRGDVDLKLQIRIHGQYFILAKWPREGDLHHRDCHFHENDATRLLKGASSTAAIAIRQEQLNARLDQALSVKTNARPPQSTGSAIKAPAKSTRRKATSLAFLQALWVMAGLNYWRPSAGMGSWPACFSALQQALVGAVINRRSAADVLHVMQPYTAPLRDALNAELDAFFVGAKNDKDGIERRMLIGELASIKDGKYDKMLTLRQNARSYFVAEDVLEAAKRRNRFAAAAIGQEGARVVALLLIEPTTKGNLRIVECSYLLCSQQFIPCDSSHEVAMANLLVRSGRRFEKPMRVEQEGELLPDFVLHDVDPICHIEVYGLNGNPAYERRKEAKQAIRIRKRTPCVEWNVEDDIASVTFPPILIRSRLDTDIV